MPPTNSLSGCWFGVGSVRQNYMPNSSSFPEEYTMSIGNAGHQAFQEGRVTQKISQRPPVQDYGRAGMVPSQMLPNVFLSNTMVQKNIGPSETLLDSNFSRQMTASVDESTFQMNNSSRDLHYHDHRMRDARRPAYPQQYDPSLAMHDPMMGPTDGVWSPSVGPELNKNILLGRMSGEQIMRGQIQRPVGYSNSQQRVLPYPNPQQYMQNKRAQYNAKQRMYDVDPMARSYSGDCYGNSWPQQPLSRQLNYLYADIPCRIKESSDVYLPSSLPQGSNCQLEPWRLSQAGRESVRHNNSFSPPPGNPTPPMTPGPVSTPSCPLPIEQPEVRLNAPRSFRESEPRFTFAIPEGIVKPPFQLEHNLPISCHIFNLHDQTHESLMSRSDFELMLKCFHKEDRSMTTNWPAMVSISLNEVPLLIDCGSELVPRHQPMFLKSICKPGQNTLQISVKACCCSHLFVLQIVRRPSVSSVLHSLVPKQLLPAPHSVSKIKQVMSQQQAVMASNGLTNEQQQQPFLLSLTCPISLQRMRLPSRGHDCRHVQCFDLESYLKINCEHNHWICPICKKMALLDGLEVDQYLWGILVQLSATFFDTVVFDASASWKPAPRPGVDYGNDINLCKRFISVSATALPNPTTLLTNKLTVASNLAPPGVNPSIMRETGVQKEHRQRSGSDEAPNYLGCLSQMTDVFLGSDNSPSIAPHPAGNLEHVSFPPTPMGSQISTICTPLDGQSLHPRTPSDGNTTHPHTPPDGQPFTPLDSQSLCSKTSSENCGSGGGTPRTPSAAYDSVGSGRQGTSCAGKGNGCVAGLSDSGAAVVQGSAAAMEFHETQDQCEGQDGNSGTTDLTKLDFKSDFSMDPLFALNEDGTDMLGLVPDVFDDDLSELTSYLGPNCKTPAEQTLALKRGTADDDFLSFFS